MIKLIRTHMLVRLAVLAISISAFISCAKWDEFKEYNKGGEIVYVGKLDSVIVLSGKERVKIVAQVKPDPKIRKALIRWNDGKDSLIVDIANNTLFQQYIPMPEGIVSLQLLTMDDKENRSVAVPAIGRAYGSRYSAGLSNRLTSNAIIEPTKATLDWLEMDLSAGPIATEVRYAAANGTMKTIVVNIKDTRTVISDLASSAKTVTYRTLFLPQKTSIDTFYTPFVELGLAKDVTSEYLHNYGNPIATSSVSGRWGIPSVWVTNAAVRNFRSGSNYYGGVDHWFGGPFLAMEAGWSGDNLATITNGKIFQTVTLPPGHYTFEMDIPDCTAGGDFYTVAANGTDIPNTEYVSSSLGFLKTNSSGTHAMKFTLLEQKQVSLGFVGNLANKGSGDGTFWRINAVRLKQIVIVQ
ncbi:DUF4998 domain-containing protein [Sphingobacterium bovistauri]|uniref:DUF5013 domain-containing protein n=1 Tax=Sphingobacterium bovistauri TaxID=2781959 RepID=A0ABS7Z5E3_9SPHI|nr:DUF4998 domain-containing protein [Sphingobacterium bovistauri]MCA5005362.1 DUF5013 domain-containing protein [Sphingobacterium bovistauri]